MDYKISDLFRGKFPNPQKLYALFLDFEKKIDEKSNAKPVTVYDVKLNKTQLKKAFGDPKEFEGIGIVHNAEGSYMVVADKYGHWLFYGLDEV